MRLHNRSDIRIGQGALTNSKRRESFVEGVYPTHVKYGHQCYLWDTDGKRYVDYICGLGSNLVGYGCDEVLSAITSRYRKGCTLSLASEEEVLFAEEFIEAFGYHEQIKILKSGTEGCLAAVKIALANTDKKVVVKEGYHGWSPLLSAKEPPAKGVPECLKHIVYRHDEPFNWDEVGCYILEPVSVEYDQDRIDYLHCLREKCDKLGVILIFDETITGLRFPERSLAHQIGIEPDMSVMGKALAGGLPISVVAGSKEIMDNREYFVSSTWAADLVAISAARATLKLCDKNALSKLWGEGELFLEKFNHDCRDVVQLRGYPTRGVLVGNELARALFMQEACKSGLLFGSSWFINLCHHLEINDTLKLSAEIAQRIRKGQCKLEGNLPVSPFSQKVRENAR